MRKSSNGTLNGLHSTRAVPDPVGRARPRPRRLPPRSRRPKPAGALRRAHADARPAPEALRRAQRGRAVRRRLAAGARGPDGPRPVRARRRDRRAGGHGARRAPARPRRPRPARRPNAVVLTDDGTATLRRARRLVGDSARELLGALDEAEVETLVALLAKIEAGGDLERF